MSFTATESFAAHSALIFSIALSYFLFAAIETPIATTASTIASDAMTRFDTLESVMVLFVRVYHKMLKAVLPVEA